MPSRLARFPNREKDYLRRVVGVKLRLIVRDVEGGLPEGV